MAVFALVHRSWHVAWCWERLAPELDARGHRAVAIDLPIEDPNAGLTRYAELVAETLERSSILCRDERVIAPAWTRTMSRELLGVEPIALEGGHSPFLSRPAELANVLVRLG